ncbi:hypothetical protein BST61_g3028 [Cercospora zeina]
MNPSTPSDRGNGQDNSEKVASQGKGAKQRHDGVDSSAVNPISGQYEGRRKSGGGLQVEAPGLTSPNRRTKRLVHGRRTAEEERYPLPPGTVVDDRSNIYNAAFDTRAREDTLKPLFFESFSPAQSPITNQSRPLYNRYPYEEHQARAHDRSDMDEIHSRFVLGGTKRGWLTTEPFDGAQEAGKGGKGETGSAQNQRARAGQIPRRGGR